MQNINPSKTHNLFQSHKTESVLNQEFTETPHFTENLTYPTLHPKKYPEQIIDCREIPY
jgi:hypothetical protein